MLFVGADCISARLPAIPTAPAVNAPTVDNAHRASAWLRCQSAIAEQTDPKPPLGDQGEVARRSRDGGDQNLRLSSASGHSSALGFRQLTTPQSRFASQLRVAAKPSRPALRSAKASGCWAAAVACSATGSAPLRATSTRPGPGAICSGPRWSRWLGTGGHKALPYEPGSHSHHARRGGLDGRPGRTPDSLQAPAERSNRRGAHRASAGLSVQGACGKRTNQSLSWRGGVWAAAIFASLAHNALL